LLKLDIIYIKYGITGEQNVDWPAGVVARAKVGQGVVGRLLPRALVNVSRPVHALAVGKRGQVRVPKNTSVSSKIIFKCQELEDRKDFC
jgi:hypothetical protein